MNGYLTKIPPDSENKPLEWVGRMLQHDQGLRPTAQKLMEMITNNATHNFVVHAASTLMSRLILMILLSASLMSIPHATFLLSTNSPITTS